MCLCRVRDGRSLALLPVEKLLDIIQTQLTLLPDLFEKKSQKGQSWEAQGRRNFPTGRAGEADVAVANPADEEEMASSTLLFTCRLQLRSLRLSEAAKALAGVNFDDTGGM